MNTVKDKLTEWFTLDQSLIPLEKQKKDLDKQIRLLKKQKTIIEPQLIEFLESNKRQAFDVGNNRKVQSIISEKKKGYTRKYLLAEVKNYLKQLEITNPDDAASALVQHLKDNRATVVKKSLVLSTIEIPIDIPNEII